jgi:lipid-A-disaccharide synthase
VTLDNISLVNLVLNESVVRELIQREASARNILAALERYQNDRSYCESVLTKLHTVPALLGGEGASEQAAGEIAGFL